jgi:hypothetical protein
MTSLEICYELRVQFYGSPSDLVKSNNEKTVEMMELLKEAYQPREKTFSFFVVDEDDIKPRSVCERGFLALYGLLTSKMEIPTTWKKMKAALRRGNLDISELEIERDSYAIKREDATAFIASYSKLATEAIPISHNVKGMLHLR